MKLGLVNWKQIRFLIKYSKSNVFKKSLRFFFSAVRLKSPIDIIFLHSQEIPARAGNTFSRKYFSFSEECLYRRVQSHFRTLTILTGKTVFYSIQFKNWWLAAFVLFNVFAQWIKFWKYWTTLKNKV